jgi:hypothetical protein
MAEDNSSWLDSLTSAWDSVSDTVGSWFDWGSDSGSGNVYNTQEIANTAKQGEPGFGWKYYSDGTTISPEGVYYHKGTPVWDPANPEGSAKQTQDWLSGFGSGIANTVKRAFTDKEGNVNWGNVAALGGGIASLLQGNQNKPVGYQGDIPSYTMVRQQVPGTYDPNRRPGSAGRNYFTDTQYISGDTAAAKEAAAKQGLELAAANTANPANQIRNPAAGYPLTPVAPAEPVAAKAGGYMRYADGGTIDVGGDASNGTPSVIPPHIEYQMQQQNFAQGGIANLAGGKYLAGRTDGMADKIPATIADKQPAKLSHGEFVIPADVVSHLGNGNSEAGADRLYSMMDKIRQARTGTKKQGKQINPNKFLPA